MKIMIKKADKRVLTKTRQLLKNKAVRDADGLFAVEGVKIIKDINLKTCVLDFVLISNSFARKVSNEKLLVKLKNNGVCIYSAEDASFEKISSLKNSQGILAVVKKNENKLTVSCKKDVLVIVCDGIQDPGNLGTIIRSAAAFGVDSVLLTGESADIYNPKVIRASSGAIFDVPVYCRGADFLDVFRRNGYKIIVSTLGAENTMEISEIKKNTGSFVLVFGNEGKGVSREIKSKADMFFHIPIKRRVESLNVTAAVAVTLYEFKRGLMVKN